MQVVMLKIAAGPDGIWLAGNVRDLPEETAKQFIEAGAAILNDPAFVVTKEDIAKLSSTSTSTVDRWRRNKDFPTPIAKRWPLRWKRSDVESWLSSGGPDRSSEGDVDLGDDDGGVDQEWTGTAADALAQEDVTTDAALRQIAVTLGLPADAPAGRVVGAVLDLAHTNNRTRRAVKQAMRLLGTI